LFLSCFETKKPILYSPREEICKPKVDEEFMVKKKRFVGYQYRAMHPPLKSLQFGAVAIGAFVLLT
jgi:hypothetical protein